MENIFRHLDRVHGKLSPQERLTLIVTAVKEVRFPIIASTIASLVVFVPLAFTSDLSNAVLGDLAKTVVFSHGLSAFVALILVPTVRLQLLSYSGFMHTKPPIERQILWLEKSYSRALGSFMARPRLQLFTYVALTASLIALLTTVLPKLPREIIGLPDTDWIVFGIDTEGNNSIAQMESFVEEEEAELLNKFGDKIQYTFTQLRDPNSVTILARLKDKSQMTEVWKAMEKAFPNTSFTNYYVTSWNPAEMPIPNPPHLRVVIRGGKINDRAETATAIRDLLQDKQVFPRFQSTPATGYEENIVFIPNREQWSLLEADRASFSIFDIADLARVATNGRNIGELYLNEVRTPIHLGYPKNRVKTPEDLGSLPIAIGESLVPLRALGSIELKEVPPLYYREDGKDLYVITGQHNKGDERKIKPSQKEAERLIEEWKSSEARRGIKMEQAPTVLIEDAAKDMNEAIHQLSIAMLLSILLIFLTMVIQFGSIANAALVLVSVPLAIIGVLLSLFIFNSTLSLNSVLGIILVNGLAVANSIILVDFLKRLVESGKSPREAALEAAESRLRPILITSLTTLLGMLPIALGHGEGGRILQPLGIAVSGGLWVSMGLTLFVVPALQVAYLELRQKRAQLANAPRFLEPSLAAAGKEGFFSRGLASSDESEISKNKSSATKRKTQNLPFEGPTDTLQ
jgi:multidrug efflux pump subunit AcrB